MKLEEINFSFIMVICDMSPLKFHTMYNVYKPYIAVKTPLTTKIKKTNRKYM